MINWSYLLYGEKLREQIILNMLHHWSKLSDALPVIKCHQVKIVLCCQMPLVVPISWKICTWGFFHMLNSNLQSDLLSDHSKRTSIKLFH